MSVEVFAKEIVLASLECIDVQYEVIKKFVPEVSELKYVGVSDSCQLVDKLWNELVAEKDENYVIKASAILGSVRDYTETEKVLMMFGLTKWWYTVYATKNEDG